MENFFKFALEHVRREQLAEFQFLFWGHPFQSLGGGVGIGSDGEVGRGDGPSAAAACRCRCCRRRSSDIAAEEPEEAGAVHYRCHDVVDRSLLETRE